MTFSVCRMAPQHIGALATLEQQCFSSPWSEKALREELDNPVALFLVACTENGEVAGYVGLHLVAPEAFVDNLAVFDKFRRQGVAQALLAEACALARQRGVDRIALEVRQSNAAAQALYTKLGFVQDGRRPRFYEHPQEDALLFSLSI